MESGVLQPQTNDNTADVTWARLLDILTNNAQGDRRAALGNPLQGMQREAADNYRSSASLTSSSPSRPESPNGRNATVVHESSDLLGLSAFQHSHQHHPNHIHQQQRLAQPITQVNPSGSYHARSLFLLRQLSRRAQAATTASHTDAEAGLDTDSASVSAAAERHRLISETTGISIQVFVEWIADLLPFLLLLGWVFIFKYAGALLLTMFLSTCIVTVNKDIRRFIALRKEARFSTCVAQALTVAAFTSGAVLSTWPDTGLLKVLTLRDTQAASAIDALLLVILADSILRFGSLAPKLMIVAWFKSKGRSGAASGAAMSIGDASGHLSGAKRQRQQSRMLTVVERAVVLYRTMLPGPVWYGYLLRRGGFSPVFASLFCGFYLVLKASYVMAQMRMFALALKSAAGRGPLYGNYVGRSDSSEGTFGACPVCQDPVSTPVRLDCGHIFCEECILEWLERDRTCPMCRAQVRPSGLPSCSDGAAPLLPQVF